MVTEIAKDVVVCILNTPQLSLNRWREKFKIYGNEPANSVISKWKSGKIKKMRDYSARLIIDTVTQDSELLAYENSIRVRIVEEVGIVKHYKIYSELMKMNYCEFLEYMMFKITKDELRDGTIDWNAIDFVKVKEFLAKKIDRLCGKYEMGASFDEDKDMVLVLYRKYIKGVNREYTVPVYFYDYAQFDAFMNGKVKIRRAILSIIFVTREVKDEEYLKIPQDSRVIVLSIDKFDLDSIDKYELYISDQDADENMITFLNKITEVMLKKIFAQNYIVLKEILSRNYKKEYIGKEYFFSNAGVWEYKHPVCCALEFEKVKLKELVKENRIDGSPLRILDINLTGGLFGLRLNDGEAEVTCVDAAPGCLEKIKAITEDYNKNVFNSGGKTIKIETGYIRPDNYALLKEGKEYNSKKEEYDLIILGLGSASYINDLSKFLRKISTLLSDGGKILVSVFNSQSICENSYNIENMDFIYDSNNFRHRDAKWGLYAHTYTCQEIKDIVGEQHEVNQVYSYPVISGVISENQNQQILEYMRQIDIAFANEKAKNKQVDGRGMYNIVCATRRKQNEIIQRLIEIQEYLKEQRICVEQIKHEAVYAWKSMLRALSNVGITVQRNFVKSILLYDKKNEVYFWILLFHEDKFRKEMLRAWYQENYMEYKMSKDNINLCKERQLYELKLASGSINPFAFPFVKKIVERKQKKKIVLLYDEKIGQSELEKLYSYSGDVTMTWSVKKDTFMDFVKNQKGLPFIYNSID